MTGTQAERPEESVDCVHWQEVLCAHIVPVDVPVEPMDDERSLCSTT